MFKNYLKIAIRQIGKHKLFSALNIFGLATSMTVCLLIIMLLFDQYGYDQFHEQKDRIYRVISDKQGNDQALKNPRYARTRLSVARELAENYPFVEQAVRIAPMVERVNPDTREDAIGLEGYAVDPAFLNIFSFGWSKGTQETALEEPNTLVITETTAQKLFPNGNAFGSKLNLGDLGAFKVTGIIPTPPRRSHIQFEFLMSYASVETFPESTRNSRGFGDDHNINRGLVYVLLQNQSRQADLANALNTIAERHNKQDPYFNYLYVPQPLVNVQPGRGLASEIGVATPEIILQFLIVLGLIIILSACFNYMNLTLARSIKRAKEIGIRKVIGAGKFDILAQIIGESMLIALLALGIALVLLEYLIPNFYNLDPFIGQIFYLEKTIILYVLFLGFSLLVGLLAGILPAINVAAFQPIQAINQADTIKVFSRVRIRKFLITTQFILSLIFVLTVLIVLQQQRHVLQADLGIRTENILNVPLDGVDYNRLVFELNQLNGIEGISGAAQILPREVSANVFAKFNQNKDSIQLSYNWVSANYPDNMDIKLVAGQSFPSDYISSHEQFILINEIAARRLGFSIPEAAVGSSVDIDGNLLSILGILQDFHHGNIWFETIRPFALRLEHSDYSIANIRLSDQDDTQTVEAIKSVWQSLAPNEPFKGQFTNGDTIDLGKIFTIGSKIIGFIGLLSIIISSLGLLGMVVYTIEGKVKEVGIRKVLGASEFNIVWQLSKNFIFLLGIAVIIALPMVIFGANLWLQGFVIQMPLKFSTFAIGITIILFLGLITVLSQTYFAAKQNPVNALRQE